MSLTGALGCSLLGHVVWSQLILVSWPGAVLPQYRQPIVFWGRIVPAADQVVSDYGRIDGKAELPGGSAVERSRPVSVRPERGGTDEEAGEAPEGDAAGLILYKPDLPEALRQYAVAYKAEPMVLRVLLSTDGSVSAVEKFHSCGNAETDELVRRYVRRWKFMPRRSIASPEWVRVPFNWK